MDTSAPRAPAKQGKVTLRKRIKNKITDLTLPLWKSILQLHLESCIHFPSQTKKEVVELEKGAENGKQSVQGAGATTLCGNAITPQVIYLRKKACKQRGRGKQVSTKREEQIDPYLYFFTCITVMQRGHPQKTNSGSFRREKRKQLPPCSLLVRDHCHRMVVLAAEGG